MPNITEDAFTADMHKSQGPWIRNNWRLRNGSRLSAYFNSLGIFNADDMTGIIFTSYYRKSLQKEINLKKQVLFYQNYWKIVELPSEDKYPPGVNNPKFNSCYHYASKHYGTGAVHVGTTTNPDEIWIYDYYLGWKKINKYDLDKIESNVENRENILRELFNTNP